MLFFKKPQARFRIKLNVEIAKVSKNGKRAKDLFQLNGLGKLLLKAGIINPFVKIPYLLGSFTDKLVITNIVTDVGKAAVASRINGAGSEAAFTYLAVGTGVTAEGVGDTALQTEITDSGLARAAATASRVTTDTTNDTAQLTNTFTVTGSKAVTESGILNASSSGVLLARKVFSAINVVNGDSLQITWKFDVD